MLTGSGIQITEDVTRKAKNTRQELRKVNNFISFYLFLNFVNRKFSREIKIADPSADLVKLEVPGAVPAAGAAGGLGGVRAAGQGRALSLLRVEAAALAQVRQVSK